MAVHFYMKPTALGRYMCYAADEALLSARGCTPFPAIGTQAAGETFKGRGVDQPVLGFADIHNYISATGFPAACTSAVRSIVSGSPKPCPTVATNTARTDARILSATIRPTRASATSAA